MLSDLKISTKLIGAIGVVVLSASVAVGWLVFRGAEQALATQTGAHLEAERNSRARLVANYFQRLNDQLRISSRLLLTQIALRDLPRKPEELHSLVDPHAGGLIDAFRYSNVVLAASDGAVLYSFTGEIPIGGDLRDGPLRDSGLGQAFAAAATLSPGAVHFVDFQGFAPSGGAPAAFVGAPVFDMTSQARLGVLIFQVSVDEISAIMTEAAGFGTSGETYLLGPDLLMRTNGRFSKEPTALQRVIPTIAGRRAIAGESGITEQVDYRGVPVIAAFAPFDVAGVRWAIVAKMDVDEAVAPVRVFRTRLLILLSVVGLVAGFALWEALRRIVLSPVAALAAGARRVAAHDYTQPVALTGRDELGRLGQSFDSMMASVDAQVEELTRARAAAERGQHLLEVAPDAVVVADARGQIVIVNAATERLFGYARHELIGKPIETLVPADAAARHVAQRDGYLEKPATRNMGSGVELLGRRKDGSLVPVEISLSPLDDPGGLLAVASVRDITDRREAQKKVRESEERLAAAASGANLGLWDVEPASGRVVVNPLFESQLGYAPFELREPGDKWAPLRGGLDGWIALLHPDDRARVQELIRQHLSGESDSYQAEHRVRAADGSFRWILSVGNSVSHDQLGQPRRVNGVHIDVTEMKNLQLDLELRYQELQRLQGLRDGLVHMIVHDLRSPLTGVMGYIDLLRTDDTATETDRSTFIDEAYTGASQMAEMISSLLDINRLEAGEMPVDRQPADLCEVTAEAIRSLGSLTIGRRVTQSAPEGAITSNCDAALIRRVVGNLLGNSLKFTPESGSITITVTRPAGRPRVEVVDTGPGIPADFIGRVFDKFSQSGEGRSRKRYSTGLGLAFCKLAVEAHGGTIGVTSEVGVGSRFWFELPS